MPDANICPDCGTRIPVDAPGGLCPKCLAGTALHAPTLVEDLTELESAGTVIGRYKLLQRIGEGGMGVVYMAEQTEPVRRKVALKIVKLGMDTREIIARFEAERQALALMDHPSIARVLDGGATDTGRPYFVMELVKGIPITEFCDKNHFPTRERLHLFKQVCAAVQHAHQKGIIHRDLKPTNILVTLHDGVPVPKVIDFGVAKAIGGQTLTEKTIFTAFGKMLGTPQYMSPEQAEFSGLDIDTRSDIYSLGVLLYELLTGSTPLSVATIRRLALGEIMRTIRETDAPKPSTRVSSLDQDADVIAGRRGESPDRLSRLLRGDLDWVVMKSLEKDRNRRYESATGLASDVQRYLNDEPVMAGPPTLTYKLRKFSRRHKVALGVSLLVVTLLLVATAVSTWLAIEAGRARASANEKRVEAQAEAARSAQVAQFMRDMLSGVTPSVARGRDTTVLREILDDTARRLEAGLSGPSGGAAGPRDAQLGSFFYLDTQADTDLPCPPEVEADLRHMLGKAYFSLSEYDKAEAMMREALALRRTVHRGGHLEVASALTNLAELQRVQAKYDDSEASFREALAIQKSLAGTEHLHTAWTLERLGSLLCRQHRPNEAEPLVRQSLEIRRKLLGHEDPAVAMSLNSLHFVLKAQGRLPEAERTVREALALFRQSYAGDFPWVARTEASLGKVLYEQGNYGEAETNFLAALQVQRRVLGDHRDTALTLVYLGRLARDRGQLAEAGQRFREALSQYRKAEWSKNIDVPKELGSLADLFRKEGQLAEAEAAYRDALASRLRSHPGQPSVATLQRNFGKVLFKQGKYAQARTNLLAALRVHHEVLGDHRDTATTLEALGHLAKREGKPAEAEHGFRETVAMRRTLFGDEHPDVVKVLPHLTTSLLRQGKLPEAEEVCREVLAVRRRVLGNEHQDVADALDCLAEILKEQGKVSDAETAAREGAGIRRRIPEAVRLPCRTH